MKWEDQRRSSKVEDQRGGPGFPGAGRRVGGKGLGLGSIAIALVAAWIFGINPLTVLGLLGGVDGGGVGPATPRSAPPPPDDREAAFVSTVLADTEDVWQAVFRSGGQSYREPVLVLFRGAVPTACGTGQSAMGPFYCPGDMKVYIDLDFFQTLAQQLGAPGDFAQAYVIAHEVGHHVQRLIGVTEKVDAMRGRISEAQMNAMSVRVELQADCLAGVWTHHSQRGKGWLEQGDVAEAMNAAQRIGDDTLQQQSQGRVRPESFTHGSSAQRLRWFDRGVQSGQVAACNTFDAGAL